MVSEEFDVRIYDKAREPIGFIGDVQLLTATPRHNQQPTASIELAADDPKCAALQVDGTRVVIRYRDEHTIGGPVRSWAASGTGNERKYTFQIVDDYWLLSRILGWQVPGSAITAQSGTEYRTITGPAETVVKTLLGENVTRLSEPVTIATNLGRGDTITVKTRMDQPADILFPLVDQAGIGITVRQVGTGLVLDCYEPTAWPITLSEDGGTLTESAWSRNAPEMTRVIVQGGGDGTARVYRRYINTTLEAALGYVIEGKVDARDIDPADPALEALMSARGQAALAAAAATSGLSVELSETDVFRYGGAGVHVGDSINVELTTGNTLTDILRSATLTWSPAGIGVTPVIGERRDDPTEIIARAIAATNTTLRKQARS